MAPQSTTLTHAQYERAWQLTLALAQNDSSARKSLDMLFIQASRFVAKVDGAVQRGEVVELDTGKGGVGGKVMFTVAVRDGSVVELVEHAEPGAGDRSPHDAPVRAGHLVGDGL